VLAPTVLDRPVDQAPLTARPLGPALAVAPGTSAAATVAFGAAAQPFIELAERAQVLVPG
jgi:hypothetical protein